MKLKRNILVFWMVCLAWMLPLCVKADNMIISMGSLLVNAQFQEFRFEEGTDQKHSVHIKKPGRLTIEFKNENAGNYIRVFSKETAKDVLYYEECLMEGSEEKPEMFSFSLDLMPGEYYLLHENIGNTGYYEVKASFIPALSEETESNNTEESAMPLVYGKTIHGFISSDPVQWENSENRDYTDYYSFEIDRGQDITIKYSRISTDTALDIYVRRGNTIYFAEAVYNGGTYAKKVELKMPGKYYICVQGTSNYAHPWEGARLITSGEYSLSVSPGTYEGLVYTDPYTGLTYTYNGRGTNTRPSTVTLKKVEDKSAVSVVVPDTIEIGTEIVHVTEIGKKAFAGCKKLKKVVIGNNVKLIKEQAFSKCTALKEIVGMNNVKEIEKKAFYRCTALKTLKIPSKKLTDIHVSAFEKCKRLKTVTIESKRLFMIANRVFYGCNKLRKVTIKSQKIRILGDEIFSETSGKCVIRVPKQKVKTYRTELAEEIKESGIRIRRIK